MWKLQTINGAKKLQKNGFTPETYTYWQLHLSPPTLIHSKSPLCHHTILILTTSMTCVLHLDSSCRPLRARSNSSLYSSSDFWLSRPEPVTTSLLL